MKFILITLFLVSCAHKQPQNREDLVSVLSALDQAQMSYLKGCVDAMKDQQIPVNFENCRDKSKAHRLELDSIMDQDLY